MRASALLALLSILAADAAVAGELRAVTGGPGLRLTGPLSGLDRDARRQPREALHAVAKARRDLAGDTSIEADRVERRLDDIERDAARSLRRSAAAADLARLAAGSSGLPLPAMVLPPYPRDIRGQDAVLGTGKAFVRIGRLLGRSSRGGAAVQEAKRLLEQTLHANPGVRVDDPQVVATRARIAQLEAGITASQP
jgi:hypothetical protein